MRKRAFIAAQLAGLLLVLTGVAAFVYWQRTPPILLQHSDPHDVSRVDKVGPFAIHPDITVKLNPVRLLAVSPYAANVKTDPRPAQPHTGLWVEIPALQIELPVRPGDGSDKVPQWEALTYPGTAKPGSAGNSYIYAHGLWGMFGGLLFARTGDVVRLHNYETGSVQTLHVTRVVGRVAYRDNHWLRLQSATPLLTLQTCIDFNPKGDRYIVLAG